MDNVYSETMRLGAHLDDSGCSFRLRADEATRVELVLIDPNGSQTNIDMVRREQIWSIHCPGITAGQLYGFRVHGSWDPSRHLTYNPAKLLVDPYARAITAGIDYDGAIYGYHFGKNDIDHRDSAASVPLSVTVAPSAPPRPISRRYSMDETVIYEAHVKGMTRLHPSIPEHLRGTYAGLAHPAIIDHLHSLKVTAIELLPVHHFISEPFLARQGLTNYWGYNTLGYFAPHASYCSIGTRGEQVEEFKTMVSAFHDAGIEVILDVVYNHTCEAGSDGPTLSWRGIDQAHFYRHGATGDYDVTGCGNSVDTSHPHVCAFIIDSLRYWVEQMGIDGFRFDLASTLIRSADHGIDQGHLFKSMIASDPLFDQIKMIAEPWDVGPYGYQVGRWGHRWSEWNDRYRSSVRDFWRGQGNIQDLATRLVGSADLFSHDGRHPSASVNFITAHDGFTLRDLTTYEQKHNEANGESNRDGSNDNRSWNCGVEGESDDETITTVRLRQMKNMMATLLLSRGVPMICAGDEHGRTQGGNNNAYCQDNRISWMDWIDARSWSDLYNFVCSISTLRAEHDVFRADDYRYREEITDPNGYSLGRYCLAWMNGYSGEMSDRDWHDGDRKLLGMYLADEREAWLIWFYSGESPIRVIMPPIPWGWSYTVHISSCEEASLPTDSLEPGQGMMIDPHSITVMKVSVPTCGPIALPNSTDKPR